jgi:hypothetical protein
MRHVCLKTINYWGPFCLIYANAAPSAYGTNIWNRQGLPYSFLGAAFWPFNVDSVYLYACFAG